MAKKNPFRAMRAISDRTLSAVLTNHADVLRVGVRERRLLLALHVAEVVAIVWLVFRVR